MVYKQQSVRVSVFGTLTLCRYCRLFCGIDSAFASGGPISLFGQRNGGKKHRIGGARCRFAPANRATLPLCTPSRHGRCSYRPRVHCLHMTNALWVCCFGCIFYNIGVMQLVASCFFVCIGVQFSLEVKNHSGLTAIRNRSVQI